MSSLTTVQVQSESKIKKKKNWSKLGLWWRSEVSNSKNKKNGATIIFQEGLENTPFKDGKELDFWHQQTRRKSLYFVESTMNDSSSKMAMIFENKLFHELKLPLIILTIRTETGII